MTYRAYHTRLAKLEAHVAAPGTNAEAERQRALVFEIMSDPTTRDHVMQLFAQWAQHQDATHDYGQPCPAFSLSQSTNNPKGASYEQSDNRQCVER